MAWLDQPFVTQWSEAARISLGFFWTAFWAFVLGYLVSASIQVFVTRERMQRALGEAGPKSVALATFFGFVSSSCSFAALATTKSLLQKGAGLVPSLAFLLASTNLVVELGIVIAVFLVWPFVLGEYLGGLLLIAGAWAFVAVTRPTRLVAQARARLRADAGESGSIPDWRRLIRSREGWARVGRRYVGEWRMVWRVFPVLRINAQYYGWRMALYLLVALLVALVAASLLLHAGFAWLDWLPERGLARSAVGERSFFTLGPTLWLDLGAVLLTGGLVWLARSGEAGGGDMAMGGRGRLAGVLRGLALLSLVWLVVGLLLGLLRAGS